MAWQNAQQREIGDWLQRLRENDPKLTSLTVFKTRKFVAKVISVQLSAKPHASNRLGLADHQTQH